MKKNKPFDLPSKVSQSSSKQPAEDISSSKKNENKSEIPLSSKVNEMVERMKNIHDELDRKLDEVYQKSGWSYNLVKKYLENPSNFNVKEWERIQNQRQTLLDAIWQKLGKQKKKKDNAEEKAKATKERKMKTLGARRNWLPIR